MAEAMRRLSRQLRQLNALVADFYPNRALQALASCCSVTNRQLSSLSASTSEQSNSAVWTLAALPLLGFAAVGNALAEAPNNVQKDEFHVLPLASRQRIFFKYEKRIRDNSSLDKVFEYFSSLEKDNQKFLTPVDLARAVVPTYPPSESQLDRSGSLDGERTIGRPQASWDKSHTEFFNKFDVDGDGVISYPEFLLVLALLTIREEDVRTVFKVVDLDGTGDIDHDEFKVIMERLQAMANIYTSRIGRSHKLSTDPETGLLLHFFGEDGTKRLHLAEFETFLTDLHSALVEMEFVHYDIMRRGSIPAVDFARSLVATADVRHVDRLLDKVDAMPPELRALRISRAEFKQVHQLRRKLHTLVVALDFIQQVGRPLGREDFSKLTTRLTDVTLPEHVVDIVFEVFGTASGQLDAAAFLEVMQRREVMWARRRPMDADGNSPVSVSKWIGCVKQCAAGE